ncbi:MAG TPA: FlgD immunoglobulin-like domain containing protein, partial [Candidatus Krumholzibacteria bacterium]|nr:FlgD immunoglobulin-like domain containing protein [Candidatus Krumholzibacteria bacterium]
KWIGANAPGISNGSIHRRIGVKGNQASEYDTTSLPSEMNCTPPPVGVGDTPSIVHARIWSSPNPFKTSTNVEFSLDAPADAQVAIYAVDGSLVRVLAKQSFPAGRAAVAWDGTDRSGKSVASGTYLARLSGRGFSATARVTVIR